MIAGSNPDQMPVVAPNVDGQGFSTEFRVEVYTPPYLSGANAGRRPTAIVLSTTTISTGDGASFGVGFTIPDGAMGVSVVLYHGGFVTHAVHMGQRMIILESTGWVGGATQQSLGVQGPPSNEVAPPGPYVVYVVADGVPGMGRSVMVG